MRNYLKAVSFAGIIALCSSVESFVPSSGIRQRPMLPSIQPRKTDGVQHMNSVRHTASSSESGGVSERISLEITEIASVSSLKSPKDAYKAFAEKGAANSKMSINKILHQSILGGAYVGFAGLLSLCVAGNLGPIASSSPGIAKMTFAALFPVNLLLIATTGGQLFTGNSATVAAAKFEGMVEWGELVKSWAVSLAGNVIGCALFAIAACYVGALNSGAAALCTNTAIGKCSMSLGQTVVKAILCNWMVSMALFLSGAANDMAGKLIGIWFPISLFVAVGFEHSVANLFMLPAAMLLKAPLSIGDILWKNLVPVVAGNAIAGAFVVAASYSYQFGRLGRRRKSDRGETFRAFAYEARKLVQGDQKVAEAAFQ